MKKAITVEKACNQTHLLFNYYLTKGNKLKPRTDIMLSTLDHALKLPTHFWVDHILPTLPLTTVLCVTTRLDKRSRDDFSKHKEAIWKNFIKQQHPYLKAIARACSNFGRGSGEFSWFEYIKYCQDLSTKIEYTGAADVDGKGLRQGYKLAYNVGRAHYILYTDNMYYQINALVELKINSGRLERRDADYFVHYPSDRLKHQDVFNTLIVFMNMFDPAFAHLYMDVQKKLKSLIQQVKSQILELGLVNTEEIVEYIIKFILVMFNEGFKNWSNSKFFYFEKRRLCTALRYFMRFEKITTSGRLHNSFLVLCEMLNKMGYPVDIHSAMGSFNEEEGVGNRFIFSLMGDKTTIYHIDSNQNGFSQGKFSLIGKKRPIWFQDEYYSDDESEEALYDFASLLNAEELFGEFSEYEEYERDEFGTYVMKAGERKILSFVAENEYGILSFPGNVLDISSCMNFDHIVKHKNLGKFARTKLWGLAVIVGFNIYDFHYFFLSMDNEIFTEHMDDVDLNLKFSDEELKGLRSVFKYQTYIGEFFESFENGKYTGYQYELDECDV